jgi:lipooligosaccharide transport system ATP-binding protein
VNSVVEAKDLRKTFGDLVAVDGISFHVLPGECFGILGPNGAGKTSTIRMIYGFSPMTGGTLQVFGLPISSGWRTIKSRIGVCQQENTLDPDLSVQQNLEVFARYFNVDKKQAQKRAGDLLAFFGLDPQSRHQVWQRLEELRSHGLSILLTTHYMDEASRLCDRLVIMDHGRILVEGKPGALIKEHVGQDVIEVTTPSDDLRAFIQSKPIIHEDLGHRLIIYGEESDKLFHQISDVYCKEGCTLRMATLEDVFLRLTGRGLRE